MLLYVYVLTGSRATVLVFMTGLFTDGTALLPENEAMLQRVVDEFNRGETSK